MARFVDIEALVSDLFRQRWAALDREALARPDLIYPGVYLLAFTSEKIAGETVKPDQVLYAGMSNSAGGVRARLKQFIKGIEKNDFHSGAMRFYREYCGGKPFSQLRTRRRLYVAALAIECKSDKVDAQPDDLRLMGHVACLEYYAIARIAQKTGKKPALNKYGPREAA
ncbi:hypothetical protein KMZ68_13880 [Bradyrhizobium sediminis]|uniref:Uncharacterized protein n=1 Tax=Bradyrhizobium sediminis TaxID=2840469 RepID=A0A975NKI6_9BRAD|nr:hypothetical protein [Bradyrhizobium sediminis]QWG16134.1 hypothetical protein KMZ68_13880 [Bradyrhizobium sediminis]